MTFFDAGMVFRIAVAFPYLLGRAVFRFFLESFGLLTTAFAFTHEKPPLGKLCLSCRADAF
jgi:hypothetical protein